MLIVEDDSVTRRQFTRFLRLEGYTVLGVADAAEAVTLVNTQPPSVILLDLHLPFMNGLECLREVRKAASHRIPIAILTGDYFLDESQLAEIKALGARVWYKPIWLDQLLALVRSLLVASA